MATAIVLLNVAPGKDKPVADKVMKVKGATCVCLVSGLYDVVAWLEAETSETLLATVYEKIRPIPWVTASRRALLSPGRLKDKERAPSDLWNRG